MIQKLLEKFKKEFNIIVDDTIPVSDDFKPRDREYYGIKVGTTCEQYLHDFRWINSDLNSVKDYIYDLDLKGYIKVSAKPKLWFSYNKDEKEDESIQMSKNVR